VTQFEFVLKGRGFGRAVNTAKSIAALQPAEKSVLHLILGGAAVHRCDNCRVVNKALASEGMRPSN
jgi:hypothetical protein